MSQKEKNNRHPLPAEVWKELLSAEGFKVRDIYFNPMHLVEPKQIFDDEGFFRAIRIFFNILTHHLLQKEYGKSIELSQPNAL